MFASVRLWGAIGIAALLILAAVWIQGVVKDRDRLRDVENRGKACVIAIEKGETTIISCPQAISDAATRARRYLGCDAALNAGDLAGVRAECSGAVKARDAVATALQFNNGQLAEQLVQARTEIATAINRADARFDSHLRKDRNAQAAISQAPRSGDGRIRCDDRCLRDLTGG